METNKILFKLDENNAAALSAGNFELKFNTIYEIVFQHRVGDGSFLFYNEKEGYETNELLVDIENGVKNATLVELNSLFGSQSDIINNAYIRQLDTRARLMELLKTKVDTGEIPGILQRLINVVETKPP